MDPLTDILLQYVFHYKTHTHGTIEEKRKKNLFNFYSYEDIPGVSWTGAAQFFSLERCGPITWQRWPATSHSPPPTMRAGTLLLRTYFWIWIRNLHRCSLISKKLSEKVTRIGVFFFKSTVWICGPSDGPHCLYCLMNLHEKSPVGMTLLSFGIDQCIDSITQITLKPIYHRQGFRLPWLHVLAENQSILYQLMHWWVTTGKCEHVHGTSQSSD